MNSNERSDKCWKVLNGYFDEPCYFVYRRKSLSGPLNYDNMETTGKIYGTLEKAQAVADALNVETNEHKKRAAAAFDALTRQCQRDAAIWLEGMAAVCAASRAREAKVGESDE